MLPDDFRSAFPTGPDPDPRRAFALLDWMARDPRHGPFVFTEPSGPGRPFRLVSSTTNRSCVVDSLVLEHLHLGVRLGILEAALASDGIYCFTATGGQLFPPPARGRPRRTSFPPRFPSPSPPSPFRWRPLS